MSCFSCIFFTYFFFFSSRRRHTRCLSDWSSDVCSSDLLSAQVHTPHASRFIGVGEASFQKLSPIPQQLFPVLAVNAPPVVIHRLPRLRLILPATASTVRFRNIAPNLGLLQRRQRVVAVISLVRHCFDRTFRMDSFPYFFVVRGAGNFGDVLPR